MIKDDELIRLCIWQSDFLDDSTKKRLQGRFRAKSMDRNPERGGWYCPNCHAIISRKSWYCVYCGQRVTLEKPCIATPS